MHSQFPLPTIPAVANTAPRGPVLTDPDERWNRDQQVGCGSLLEPRRIPWNAWPTHFCAHHSLSNLAKSTVCGEMIEVCLLGASYRPSNFSAIG